MLLNSWLPKPMVAALTHGKDLTPEIPVTTSAFAKDQVCQGGQ